MEQIVGYFRGASLTGPAMPLDTIMLSVLLAFALSHVVAWVYWFTHTGLSYSRTFTQSIVLISVIVCLMIMVISHNVVAAFGLLGAMAIIRFRNVLKDTRDTVFIFTPLVQGMAVGAGLYGLAIAGTLGLAIIMLYLHWTAFGTRSDFDAFLRCRLIGAPQNHAEFGSVVNAYCLSYKQISARHSEHDAMSDYSFHVKFRDRNRSFDFIRALQELQGIDDVSLVQQEEFLEA